MARKGIIISIICLLLFAYGEALSYNIYLKNNKVFDAIEHKQERGLFIIKLRSGYEIGIPIDDIDMEKTKRSISDYEERKRKEKEDIEKRKFLEEREKVKKELSELAPFAFEKRGMQTQFAEDEVGNLLSIGEKYASRMDDILKPYTFFYDYIPSVVYTKRLRLILYGVEKSQNRRNIVTTEIHNIIQDPYLLIFLVLTGEIPDFFKGAKIHLEQDGRLINPFTASIPELGDRTIFWPDSPAYFFKFLINFAYKDIDITKEAKLVVRKNGYLREFSLDFPSYR